MVIKEAGKMKTLAFIFSLMLIIPDVNGQQPPVAPEGMVYVPAGNFIMGSEYGDPDERPKQIAYTTAFFIDQYEVSNAEFAKFDPDFKDGAGRENNAVIVTWSQANNYAKWAGKRLPNEKEWEKAARGTDGRMFPWGNTFDDTYVVWDQRTSRGGSIAKPESPYGCFDMAGSVWEWTADWYHPYPGNDIPMEQYGETYKVMRGGSNFNNYSFYRTTQRYYLLPEEISNYPVGFRCVKDI
jgi:iron(II)-dependent oxidoreductase